MYGILAANFFAIRSAFSVLLRPPVTGRPTAIVKCSWCLDLFSPPNLEGLCSFYSGQEIINFAGWWDAAYVVCDPFANRVRFRLADKDALRTPLSLRSPYIDPMTEYSACQHCSDARWTRFQNCWDIIGCDICVPANVQNSSIVRSPNIFLSYPSMAVFDVQQAYCSITDGKSLRI